MSENLQQVIFYTCLLAVFYMVGGSGAVVQGLIAGGIALVVIALFRLAFRWWYGPDTLRSDAARDRGEDR